MWTMISSSVEYILEALVARRWCMANRTSFGGRADDFSTFPLEEYALVFNLYHALDCGQIGKLLRMIEICKFRLVPLQMIRYFELNFFNKMGELYYLLNTVWKTLSWHKEIFTIRRRKSFKMIPITRKFGTASARSTVFKWRRITAIINNPQ